MTGRTCRRCPVSIGVRATYCAPCYRDRARERATEWRLANPEHHRRVKRECRAKNPEKYRNLDRQKRVADPIRYAKINLASCLRRRYGVTVETYDALVVAQQGRCAICAVPETPRQSLAVDHCHGSDRVRGLLCDNCNMGIGLFNDRPEVLESAIAYLLRSRGDE